jgi:hypothetical protein
MEDIAVSRGRSDVQRLRCVVVALAYSLAAACGDDADDGGGSGDRAAQEGCRTLHVVSRLRPQRAMREQGRTG